MDSKKYIGYGGFANVFLVTRKSDGVLVAMKESQRPLNVMPDEEKRAFKREIDAMKKFESPFIVKLLEAFEQNDHFYLATKYADGGSLNKHLETYQNKKLPIDEAVRFFTMICLGLNYIHT